MGSIDPRQQVPAGQIVVTPHEGGWFLIQIGRARYTKRFNLSRAEASELVDRLAAYFSRARR